MRKPIVAGQFYSADKTVLENEVKNYIKRSPDDKIKAAIVPHAGYFFSGKCAASVYSVLPTTETYILIGVNHNVMGKDIALSLENFETPLDIVNNDTELGKEIIKLLKIGEDNNAHKYEHSIEVQLPFLQIIQETQDFKIVPIILKNYNLESCKKLAKVIVDASKNLKRKIIVLASSDFTHAGPSYGFFGSIDIDREAINEILKLNSKGFLEIAEKTTICGAGAIAVTIETAKLLKAEKAKLLSYYTSADIMPSENKVGYAGVVFY